MLYMSASMTPREQDFAIALSPRGVLPKRKQHPLIAGGVAAPAPGREPREDESAADEWRAYRDISDELPVRCPECAEREFGPESLK
jgi:hypothetical protein